MKIISDNQINESVKFLKEFQCKTCSQKIKIGECGDHRINTNHKDFQPIYEFNEVQLKK